MCPKDAPHLHPRALACSDGVNSQRALKSASNLCPAHSLHISMHPYHKQDLTGWPGRPRKANHATRPWSMSLPVPPTLLQPELPLLPAHPCPTHHSEQPEVPVLSRAAVGEHIGPFSIDIVEVQRKAEKLQKASPCLGCCFLAFSGA